MPHDLTPLVPPPLRWRDRLIVFVVMALAVALFGGVAVRMAADAGGGWHG